MHQAHTSHMQQQHVSPARTRRNSPRKQEARRTQRMRGSRAHGKRARRRQSCAHRRAVQVEANRQEAEELFVRVSALIYRRQQIPTATSRAGNGGVPKIGARSTRRLRAQDASGLGELRWRTTHHGLTKARTARRRGRSSASRTDMTSALLHAPSSLDSPFHAMSAVAADTATVPGGACRSFSSLDSPLESFCGQPELLHHAGHGGEPPIHGMSSESTYPTSLPQIAAVAL